MARVISAGLFALLAALSLACGGGSKPAEPTPEPTAASAFSGPSEEALARYVETTLGKSFLEDCSKADAQRDAGKICSTFRGQRENMRAYVLGLTFSEGTQWAIVEERNGQWSVVHAPVLNSDNAGVPGTPWPIRPGAEVVVTGTGLCLNVREGPALDQKAVDCLNDGSVVTIAAGPAVGDEIQWWQLSGRNGWVAADFLRYADAAQ